MHGDLLATLRVEHECYAPLPLTAGCTFYLLMQGISCWGSFGDMCFCLVPPVLRPMVELLMHSNVWYQAYVFKESANEVKVSIRSVPGAIISPCPGHPEPYRIYPTVSWASRAQQPRRPSVFVPGPEWHLYRPPTPLSPSL